MKKTAPPHVINVFRDRLVMCTPDGEPLVFKFTSQMVADLEIVSHESLSNSIRDFANQNKLKPASLVIILHSSVYFEKEYSGPGLPPSQNLEEFVDTIPFSVTSSKLFRFGSGYKQIVINREFYESLKTAFENLGYTVGAVVPGFVLGPEQSPEITAETCRVIYKKMDQITAESFTGFTDPSASFQQKEQMFLRKYQIPVIIISILALIVAAVVVPMTLRIPPTPPKRTPPVVRSSPTPLPTSAPSTASPSAQILAGFSVQILNGSGKVGQAALLSSKLRNAGFTDIQTGNNSQIQDQTEIIMSPQVASSAAQFVTYLVRDLYPDLSINTTDQTEFDLTIVIGKSSP